MAVNDATQPDPVDSRMARFTIEERAARYRRRYAGPWRTEDEFGVITVRYRRRLRIEWAELAVAGHDLWTHALWRGVIVPALTPFLRWLARRLP